MDQGRWRDGLTHLGAHVPMLHKAVIDAGLGVCGGVNEVIVVGPREVEGLHRNAEPRYHGMLQV